MRQIKLLKGGLFFLLMLCYLFSSSQANCGKATINEVMLKYEIGQFNESIDQLNICLKGNGFSVDEKVEAYRLLAMSQLAIDSVKQADNSIRQLLFLKDNFEPDSRDPERFKFEVNLVKSLSLTNTVSSVSKRVEELRLAPATISVITKKEILERGYNDIVDILKDIPGFDISVYYGVQYANVYQRGSRTSNTEKTLFLIDGVEDNNLWSNYVNISQQYPISNIKQVEIIYGPASTMYGANAFTGVINIITKQADDFIKSNRNFGIDARVGNGSYNSKFADVSYAYKKNTVSLVMTGRLNSSDRPDLSSQNFWDFNPSIYNDVNYGSLLNVKTNAQTYLTTNKLPLVSPLYTVYGVTGSADSIILSASGKTKARELDKTAYTKKTRGIPVNSFLNPTSSSYLQAKLNVNNFSIGLMQWSKTEGLGTLFTDKTFSLAATNWKTIQSYIYINYNRQINRMSFYSSTYYKNHVLSDVSEQNMLVNYATKGLGLKDLAKDVSPSYTNTHYFQQSRQFRTELKMDYTLNKNVYFISGVEFRNSQLQGNYLTSAVTSNLQDSGTIVGVTSGGNQYNVNDLGAYIQGTYRLKSGFGLTLGGRIDNNKINKSGGYGTEFSPRIVFDYSNSTFVVKTIYSRGIMNVSNFTKFSASGTRIPNPTLRTESLDNFELSFNKQFSKFLSSDIDFYYSLPHDVVGYVNIAGGKQQNQNIGNFKIFGIQHNLNYVNKDFKASFNYTYCSPKQTKSETGIVNNMVADIADHHYNIILNYLFVKRINVNWRTNYVGTKKAGLNTTVPSNPESTFDPYTVSSLTLGLFDLVKNTKITLVCNNVFDKTYYSPGPRVADGINNPSKILQMQRNYMLRLVYDF
jgi:outer membrane receptor for ferrienterochelin and colicin